eukprot:SAG31_NODE_18752_length_624_cov_0.792381_1_plen_104_part_01
MRDGKRNASRCSLVDDPTVGRAVRCDGAPNDKWWALQSDDFAVDAEAYHVSALVRAENCSGDGADIGMFGPTGSIGSQPCGSTTAVPLDGGDYPYLGPKWRNSG